MTRRLTVGGWLHGDDLTERRKLQKWAEEMRIHSLATYVVGEVVEAAVRNVVCKVATAELTDSDSDGTVGSDIEFDVDSDWDLVAI